MIYRVTHATTYHYSESVPLCHNLVRLTPREGPEQTCHYHRLLIRPAPAVSSRRADYFGNAVHYFAIEEAHKKLVVTATSRVEVRHAAHSPLAESPPWEQIRDGLRHDRTAAGLRAYEFAFDSPLVRGSEELRAYAAESFPPGRPVWEGAFDLCRRIHTDFQFDPHATTVSTPLDEAFRLRRGVCQDLTHVALGGLRSLGLSANYISGYLRTRPPAGQPRLVGADASHAWLAVYGGPRGWLPLDPTNALVPEREHIAVAVGRDYSDVSPMQGVLVGGGQHRLQVSVDVDLLDPQD